ncbi:MGMT family protein [Pseudoalteromonas phenolica]|uniref:O-6-methylguanine DNA methyltransferase n=1 Tax=Pseudoalteromonas phenolica TaxID=161398 RepID=A0A0S2K9F5_9GAMM|nr:MGMT family protein [Pseudoalteromonas phenolica]ALO44642.1 O-6-methylguanine DNA methyltransferase [Pseudoalteromonas phenolica]MBE0357676.1 methylated-DNA-protein-cysteine methyltransferase related protein [Pseudoalteromonas phenolica O-BC30]RXF02658.1 MGMT family protein [Pseudoalteromonas phenolica O-BC30]TMO55681.1 cysteine methyltransferase [Pseudoalteromonas phenolica]
MQDDFELRVHTIIGAIPFGRVATYGQIAKLAGQANYARKVGYILKSLPKESNLPWYRVINSQGKISFPAQTSKFIEQKERLESEGVIFLSNRVRLKEFQWLD